MCKVILQQDCQLLILLWPTNVSVFDKDNFITWRLICGTKLLLTVAMVYTSCMMAAMNGVIQTEALHHSIKNNGSYYLIIPSVTFV